MAEQNQSNPPRSNLLQQQPTIVGMTAEQVAEILRETIKAIKAPSEEEIQKKEAEAQRKKEHAKQSIIMAEMDMNNRISIQQMCNHHNGKYHTFVAQVTGNGDCVALCQICRRDYKWHATNDQLRQGVNLLEIPGLRETHLLAWEKQFPPVGDPPDRLKLLTRAGRKIE